MRTNPETIRMLSLDFDGCVASELYVKAIGHFAVPIYEVNKQFFNQVQKEAEESGVDLVVMLGSNRQSYRVDCDNRRQNKTESCYPVLRQIAKEIGAELETVLLPDAFTALNKADNTLLVPGETYKMAEEALAQMMTESSHVPYFWRNTTSSADHPDCRFSGEKSKFVLADPTKIGLLYFQMHYMAAKHPGKTLILDFVDDTPSVLNALKRYFTNNPLLIPPNMTLRLSHYNGKDSVLPVEYWKTVGGRENTVDPTPHRTLGMIYTENLKTFSNSDGACLELFDRDYSKQAAIMDFRSGKVNLPVHPSRPVSSVSAAASEAASPRSER